MRTGQRQEVSWYQNEYQKMQKAPLLQTPEQQQPGRVPYLEDIPTVLATSKHTKITLRDKSWATAVRRTNGRSWCVGERVEA